MSRMARIFPPLLVFLCLAFLSLGAGGCQSGGEGAWGYPAQGAVLPTVAGRAPMSFTNLEEARATFTRSCGSLTATLEDAAWLRFMGNPETVERQFRAYFEYGYTTFLIDLRSDEYAQPTKEEFVLTDSAGRSVCGRPIVFQGSPVLVDDRFFSNFELSFQHMITADLTWIRLTRTCDGSTVEWRFGPCEAPAQGPAPPPAPAGTR
jgi:hypothetical protein